MSYTIITHRIMSQHDAEQFGKWLALYKIQITGLQVCQVDANGKRHRDNALEKTVKDVAGAAGLAAGGAPAAPAAAAVVIPIIGLIPPLGAILAAISALAPVILPANVAALHSVNKRIPNAGGKPISHTELEFGLGNVSAQRLGWTEYLLGCYAQLHAWNEVRGAQQAQQVAAGRAYAARTGGYPQPWSQQPRPARGRRAPASSKPSSSQSSRVSRLRDWLADL